MRIATIGDPQLIRYVAVMQPMFAAGFVPGTIPPSKISACQDVVSATETRGAIQFLAQEQII